MHLAQLGLSGSFSECILRKLNQAGRAPWGKLQLSLTTVTSGIGMLNSGEKKHR